LVTLGYSEFELARTPNTAAINKMATNIFTLTGELFDGEKIKPRAASPNQGRSRLLLKVEA
jgi:hypothetical protein